jgi:DNA-binding LacI/PurR family transcriptional regulator
LGHRRVAFVGGPDVFLHSRHRRDAWRSTLQRFGLPADLAVDGDFCAESGAAATAELLTRPARRRPTAIVFANDLMAIAGMSAAAQLGRRVPDDLSIVGFDDIAVAAHMHPALTTVAQDALAWGRAATRAVFDLVELGVDDDRELPPARLVVRGSTAPVARRAPAGTRPKPDSSLPAAHRSAPPGRSGSTRRKP